MNYIDPLEQRDRWRTLWQVLTHDALFLPLITLALLAALALMLLPQAPDAAEAGGIVFNQWTADMRLAIAQFDALQITGVFNIAQAIWPRVVLIALCAIICPRLLDRILRIVDARGAWQVSDEQRARVTDQAPALASMSNQLRGRRYRVSQKDDGVLRASRAPLAEALSIVLHLGALALALGALLNITLGWDAYGQTLIAGQPLSIRDQITLQLQSASSSAERAALDLDGRPVSLLPRGSVTDGSRQVMLRALLPGYRVTATSTNGAPLKIRTSNYTEPSDDPIVNFGPERQTSLAIPDANIVVTLLQRDDGATTEVQVAGIGSGEAITSVVLAPTLQVAGTALSFEPSAGATVDVHNRPGNTLAWAGLALLLLGLLGAIFLPMRRMLVRTSGAWTECYASGRGVRADVLAVFSPPGDEVVHRT
jgi:hypothetical protein